MTETTTVRHRWLRAAIIAGLAGLGAGVLLRTVAVPGLDRRLTATGVLGAVFFLLWLWLPYQLDRSARPPLAARVRAAIVATAALVALYWIVTRLREG